MRKRYSCSVCNGHGHNKLTCPKVVGYEMAGTPRWKRYQNRRIAEGLCAWCGKQRGHHPRRCDECYLKRYGQAPLVSGQGRQALSSPHSVGLRIEASDWIAIRRLAEKNGWAPSALMRAALKHVIANPEAVLSSYPTKESP